MQILPSNRPSIAVSERGSVRGPFNKKGDDDDG
jgi:hypothetical protein